MKNTKDHPENLGVRARRGALLPGELAELTEVLDASPELQVAYQLGRDFDRVAAVQSRDEERLARFVSAALEARKPRRRAGVRAVRVAALTAAAVFALCGVAFAVRAAWTPAPPTESVAKRTPAAAPARAPRAAVLGTANTEPPLPLPAASVAEPASAPRAANAPSRAASAWSLDAQRAASSAPFPPPPELAASARQEPAIAAFALEPSSATGEPNAAALLRQADAARSIGDLARTAALLEELERRFPGSPEAHVALVSLGKLQMLSGAPSAALERFSSYLKSGGPLEEEALVGRAQTLAKLGRSSEERATWQTLLVRFPGSVYAAQARERLSALGAGATK